MGKRVLEGVGAVLGIARVDANAVVQEHEHKVEFTCNGTENEGGICSEHDVPQQ